MISYNNYYNYVACVVKESHIYCVVLYIYNYIIVYAVVADPNMISLESCFYPGQHVGIQNNGNAQTPSATGRGGNASYTVELVEAAGPSSSLYLQHCNTVSLIAASTGKPLRIRDDVVDGKGSRGGAWSECYRSTCSGW